MDRAIDWTPEQATEVGTCFYCGRIRRLRLEPFGQAPACRACWEQICYGEEE